MCPTKFNLWISLSFVFSIWPLYSDEQVERELEELSKKIPAFTVISLPKGPGEVVLKTENSLTIEHLRGVDLDDTPPPVQKPAKPYAPNMTDSFPPGESPYEAAGIHPFRFRYFQCEFNYGGWHNFKMADYAATHGFNIIYPYVRTIEEGAHLPKDTQWLSWGGFVEWHKWFPEHQIAEGRYDRLMDLNLVEIHTGEGKFERKTPPATLSEAGDSLMIDMEHPVLSPEQLRQQPWYPREGSESFEKGYYDGYAQTYLSAVKAARLAGWKNISIYGWAPYGRTWGGLEKPEVDPGTDHAWNAFGKQIYDAVDLIHNSVYCFYSSPQNVAYTLASIDANRALIQTMPVKKPLRPYYWTLLHGGGGGWRWWLGQPIFNEEKRAMTALAFFTGIDGFDTWNWSGTGNHHQPVLSKSGAGKDFFGSGSDVMLKSGFECLSEDGGTTEAFGRYDVLHLHESGSGEVNVRFQKIRKGDKNDGVNDHQPFFVMPIEKLEPHLRAKSEPVSAMIEGMALVKPLEYSLRHGEVKVDVPARLQFQKTLPIVRRVKAGAVNIIATYDPGVVYGGSPGEIVLEDFDGREGQTLRLPADDQVRIFILRELP